MTFSSVASDNPIAVFLLIYLQSSTDQGMAYLAEVRQQSRRNQLLTFRKSLTAISDSSTYAQIDCITRASDQLHTIRTRLSAVDELDLDSVTGLAKETIRTISQLLSDVIDHLGQTNVRTPTLESSIAYLRSLIHTRSGNMRQMLPGFLLVAWYDVSQLMSSIQNEPCLRVTKEKAEQLLIIAHQTAAWTYKQLSVERSSDLCTGFIDRGSIPYTYE